MSNPLLLGKWRSGGRRQRLSWDSDTGALTLDNDVVLAICHDEDDLRRRLTAWPEHCDLADGLGWVAAQLQGCR